MKLHIELRRLREHGQQYGLGVFALPLSNRRSSLVAIGVNFQADVPTDCSFDCESRPDELQEYTELQDDDHTELQDDDPTELQDPFPLPSVYMRLSK